MTPMKSNAGRPARCLREMVCTKSDDVVKWSLTSAFFLIVATGQWFIMPPTVASQEVFSVHDLRQIKKFVSVEVQTQGTAERLGLHDHDLTDLTRMTFLKKVPGIALEASSGPTADGTEPLHQLGFLNCEVWTVGQLQIVAYHIDCNAGTYLAQKTPATLWNRAILGYGPKDEVGEAVRKGLRTMVELFGTTFSEARTGAGGRESR